MTPAAGQGAPRPPPKPPWKLLAALLALMTAAAGWVYWQSRPVELPGSTTRQETPTPDKAVPAESVPEPATPPHPKQETKPAESILSPRSTLRSFREAPEKEPTPEPPESAPAAPAPPPPPSQYQRYQQKQMARIFQTQCANCHGNTGKGDGPMAGPYAPLVDLSSPEYWLSANADRIRKLVLSGSPADQKSKRMPGFQGQLEAQDIPAMIEYMQGFKTESTEPTTPESP